ncbi:MFS transporter [Sneathiella marina]|uniref:MFS transporter n=1 Tax=Sneathiella marina TaxID=2950108 RepID=A0ABY4W0B4_9PROT|nr:MFS transporter [Sneathiella marina]USG60642.1 MFS transporter [Sneathiella marina]
MLAVFLSIFLDLVGFGIVIPLLPFYAEHYGASPFMVTWLAAAFSLFQLIFSYIWGHLSDRWGRRPIFLACMLLSAIAYLWTGLAETFTALILARCISGIASGKISVAQAIIADITTPETRAKGMGMVGAAFGLGFVTGPALGGLLVGTDPANPDFQTPMYVAAGLSFLGLAMAIFTVKESVSAEDKAASRESSTLDWRQKIKLILSSPVVVWLIGIFFIVSFVFSQVEILFPLWTARTFDWTPRDLGYCFAYIGILIVIMQGGLIGPLTRHLGSRRLVVVGLSLLGGGLLLTFLSGTVWIFIIATTLITFGIGILTPTQSSLISLAAQKGQQGSTLGLANTASGFGRVAGPLWAGILFDYVHFDAPFLIGGAICFVFLALLLRAVYTKLDKKPKEATS